MHELKDEQLVEEYLKGDEKLLEILIKRYLGPIYIFICRYTGETKDAEDVTQEVFVRVWKNIRRFDQNKSFKTWLFSIAKNAAIDSLKKKKAVAFSEFESEDGNNAVLDALVDPAPLPSEIFNRPDLGAALASALEELSPKYRTVLFLRYNDHFNFREIAESLGEPIHTIKSRHRRALIMLKKILS